MNTPEEPSSSNRRNLSRYPTNPRVKVSCRIDPQHLGPLVPVDALDLSTTGIRIFLKEPLAVGQDVRLELTSADLPQPLACCGKTVWALELAAAGYYCAGVHFDQPLSEDQLQLLITVPE